MKILFVSSVSSLDGGAERSLLELAGALRSRGQHVALAVWGRGELAGAFEALGPVSVLGAADPASPLGGATTRMPILRPLIGLVNRLRLGLRSTRREADWLGSVMAEHAPDVMHTNCDLSPPAAARAARTAGVPWVAHVRDHWRAWFHPRTARALREARAVIAPSAFLAALFREREIAAIRIPNPVSGSTLRRELSAEERARIRAEVVAPSEAGPSPDAEVPVGSRPEPFLVAVVGRLDEQKGTLRIIEAAERLAEVGADRVRFLVAGRGSEPFESRVRRTVVEAGVEDRVVLLGHRRDVPRWLPAVDALAVPSTGEPFGRMIVEGMHAGLPVVAFRDGAAPELIEDGRTGVLVPTGDAGALADALGALAADPARARRLGEAAKSAAMRYQPTAIADQVEQLYHRVTES